MSLMYRLISLVLSFLLLLLLTIPSRASSVDTYLKIRREVGYDPTLTYQTVQSDITAYANDYFEIKGVVTGTITRGDNLSFLFSMNNSLAILLNAPMEYQSLVKSDNRETLRVLVQVKQSITGNVVPLKVIAMAKDSEVTQREKEALTKMQAAKKRAITTHPVAVSSGGKVGYQTSVGFISRMAATYLNPEAQRIYPQYLNFIAHCNKKLSFKQLDTITVSILYFSERYRVDPRLVIAMIIAESDFDPKSTSCKGAMGLGQLMPFEAKELKLSNPYDPIGNIKGTVDLFKGKLDIFRLKGTPKGMLTWRQIELALAAYNAGAGAVRRYGGIPPYRETQNYVRKIISTYRELCGL